MATRATLSRSICSKPLQNGLVRFTGVPARHSQISIPRDTQQTLKPLRLLLHGRSALSFRPQSRCFSVFSARRGEFGPVTGGEKSEKERLKEEEGKQEAEAELTGKNSVESLARAQSVSWHRDSDNKPPSYQHRDLILPGRRGMSSHCRCGGSWC